MILAIMSNGQGAMHHHNFLNIPLDLLYPFTVHLTFLYFIMMFYIFFMFLLPSFGCFVLLLASVIAASIEFIYL
jgi:hypothetical protein